METNENVTIGAITELINKIAPDMANSIMIDNAVAIKRHDYCYVEAFAQRVEFRSERRSAAVGPELESRLLAVAGQMGDSPYLPLDGDSLIEGMAKAPKYASEGFFSNAKKRMTELMNGGMEVDINQFELSTGGGRIAEMQPSFAVKAECTVADCPNCHGTGQVERTDKESRVYMAECPDCKGLRRIGTLSYIVPKVSSKQVRLLLNLDGEIENLRFEVSGDKLMLQGEEYPLPDKPMEKAVVRFNGENRVSIDDEVVPYLELIYDKIGERNALMEMSHRIIPCHTFAYRNVLTGENRRGVVVDFWREPRLLQNLDNAGRRLMGGVRDSAKSISRFLGSLGKTAGFKNKEDLLRSARLLIAIAVADGRVDEAEKQIFTLTIRDMEQLTGGEREELVRLLGAADGGFLTEEDYRFNSRENAEETLVRMQEIAGADGEVDESERLIIEKLKLSI